jgi:L-arabinokinase
VTLALEEAEREAFIDLLLQVSAETGPLGGFFSSDASIGVARAPGRLDVMGGIADYSGSLVLQFPLREAACAAAQLHADRDLWVASVDPSPPHAVRQLRLPIEPLRAASHAEAAKYLRDSAPEWARYLCGLVVPLVRELGHELRGGVRIVVASRVPEGKGISSSAAIEVAGLMALAAAADIVLDPRECALSCQRVENLVVGAPCGVMDQMTAACGRSGELVELLCQPASLLGSRPVPAELGLFGIDSGVRHAVTGRDYGAVRVATFMGYRMLSARLGFEAEFDEHGRVAVDDTRFGGYLANVTPSELDSEFRDTLPERLSGAEFLDRFLGISDSVTLVDPSVTYAVRAATEHAIREHHRVRCFAELLSAPVTERSCRLLGELMYQSHASYSACGLGADATDRLVRLVREAGVDAGLYGAKITGAGSGGTVAVLAHGDAEGAVESVVHRFAAEVGSPVQVFSGSSAGGGQFGAVMLPGSALAPRI